MTFHVSATVWRCDNISSKQTCILRQRKQRPISTLQATTIHETTQSRTFCSSQNASRRLSRPCKDIHHSDNDMLTRIAHPHDYCRVFGRRRQELFDANRRIDIYAQRATDVPSSGPEIAAQTIEPPTQHFTINAQTHTARPQSHRTRCGNPATGHGEIQDCKGSESTRDRGRETGERD